MMYKRQLCLAIKFHKQHDCQTMVQALLYKSMHVLFAVRCLQTKGLCLEHLDWMHSFH